MLTAWGVVAESASDDCRALEMLRSATADGRDFDVVLFDADSRRESGVTFAREVRNDPALSRLKLLSMVSLNNAVEAADGDDAPVDGQITQPLKSRAVHRCFEVAIGIAAGPASETQGRVKRCEPAGDDSRVVPLRVLVAEDSAVNQKVVQFQLRKLGCQVDSASDGEKALLAVREKPYDVILMDCQMPILDGWETAGRIREMENGGTHHAWIIAMTAHSLVGDRERCMEAGMDDYLSKPVRFRELSAALERCPAGARGVPTAAAPLPADVVCQERIKGFRQLEDETGQDVLESVIDLFIERTPPIFSEARKAMGRNDATRVAHLAHSIKGSCSNFGARRMQDACERLEAVAMEGSLESVGTILDEIEREFGFVRIALENELELKSA
jgi:CheY-like chemotaxis protein